MHAVHEAIEGAQHRADEVRIVHAARRIAPDRRKHRVEREADEHRHQHRHCNSDAERIEKLPDDAAHERDRHEHRHDRERSRQHGKTDLVGPFARRRVVVFSHVDMAHDVLAHDDRIVDQQADAQAQRHHRHIVQRKAEHAERNEGCDDRDRQRESRNHGAAPAAEEEKDNQHGQQRAFDDRHLDVVDRALDEVRGRAQQLQLGARRQQLADVFGGDLQTVAHLHDVGVLRLEYVEADRRSPVDASDRAALALGIEYFGDLRQQDRRAAFARDDDLAEISRVFDAAVDAHNRFDRVVADRADRHADIRIAQRGDNLIDGQAESRQPSRVDPHLDLASHGAAERNPTDAAHAFEAFLHDLLAERRQLALRQTGPQQAIKSHRLVVLVAAALYDRVFDVARKSGANLRNLVAHFLRHSVGVDVQPELDP